MAADGSGGRGKLPVLTGRGRLLLTLAMVLLIVGTGSGNWMLAVFGVLVTGALLSLYLRFFPTAVLVWRRYLELLWWLPRPHAHGGADGLVAGRPFPLQVTLRNLGPRHLGSAGLRVFASRSVAVTRPLPLLSLPPRAESTGTLQLVAAQAGQWFLHGAAVELRDPLGLFAVEAYFPSSTPLKVLPRHGPRVALPALRLSLGAADERMGAHTLRQRGIGGELRELREYVPGDPFKLIAWKASARAPLGRLMVRDLDRETLLTHYLLLDIGASMREGRPGCWKLDHALELGSAYARAVLDGGDRIGLITYDGAIYSHLRPGGGLAQRLRLMETLLSVMAVAEEAFCGVGDAEVCIAVARYLRQQEGLELRVRRPPRMDDAQAWAGLLVSPAGELYDLRRMLQAVRRKLEQEARARPEAADLPALRQFCQRFGIELPYGRAGERALRRAAGLAAALEQVAASRGSLKVVLISDLLGMGFAGGLELVARAVALCRRRGHQLLCLCPVSRRYLPEELVRTPAAARAAEIFSWELARRETEAQEALLRLGFHVLPVGPEDGLAKVLGPPNQGRHAPSSGPTRSVQVRR